MFETLSTEALIRRHRKLWYETLPVSLVVHFAAIGLIAGTAYMQLAFPDQPPKLMFSYSVADLNPTPPPPPPPPPPPRAQIDASKPTPAPIPLDQIVAPTVIPDTIPEVPPPTFTVADIAPATPHDTAGVEGGVPGGDPLAGVVGGVLGGEPKGVLGGVLMNDGKVHFARNTPLPMYIERQDYPDYPEDLRSRGIEDDVVVRYTIDKKGRVSEILVLQHPARKEFERAALDALRAWRFRPLIVEGEAREVVHELAIYFRLK